VMERPPRDPDESLFAGGVWQHIVCVGGLMAAVCVAVQWWAIDAGVAAWQTMVFTSLVFLQLGHAVAVRSERRSVFRQGLFANRAMCGAIALTLVLHLAIVYVPFLNRLFKTQPLTAAELGCCFALDDFGTGFSSFAYLKNLPVDFLKIDGMFVVDLVDDRFDSAVIRSIVEIGKMMGKRTIAEFVESAAILRKLKLPEIGVDFAQGYHIGRPRPIGDML